MSQHHELKIHPAPFRAVCMGLKLYEVRKYDRDYKVGDTLDLREWDPARADYTGESWSTTITYLTPAGTYGLPEDLCVFGLAPTPKPLRMR